MILSTEYHHKFGINKTVVLQAFKWCMFELFSRWYTWPFGQLKVTTITEIKGFWPSATAIPVDQDTNKLHTYNPTSRWMKPYKNYSLIAYSAGVVWRQTWQKWVSQEIFWHFWTTVVKSLCQVQQIWLDHANLCYAQSSKLQTKCV